MVSPVLVFVLGLAVGMTVGAVLVNANTNVCDNCGDPTSEDYSYCHSCGTRNPETIEVERPVDSLIEYVSRGK